MKILTWNVNSIKTINRYHPFNECKNFESILELLNCDIICLQETKLNQREREFEILKSYDAYSSFSIAAGRKGASGVITYVKKDLFVANATDKFITPQFFGFHDQDPILLEFNSLTLDSFNKV